MKKIVIGCGAGLATSTMVSRRVGEILEEAGIKANITQSQLYELSNYDNKVDLIITTMKIDESEYETPVILGTAFLTGINEDAVIEKIMKILKKEN